MKLSQTKINKYRRRYFETHLDVENKCRNRDKNYQRLKRKLKLIDKTQEYREWRENNPKGAYAQGLINYLIKKGEIKRGECEFKNEFCSKSIIQAHHEDYEKPLEVRWLCASHHKKVDLGLLKLK